MALSQTLTYICHTYLMSFIGFIEKSFIAIPQETAKLIVLLHSLLKHIKNSGLSTKHSTQYKDVMHIVCIVVTHNGKNQYLRQLPKSLRPVLLLVGVRRIGSYW